MTGDVYRYGYFYSPVFNIDNYNSIILEGNINIMAGGNYSVSTKIELIKDGASVLVLYNNWPTSTVGTKLQIEQSVANIKGDVQLKVTQVTVGNWTNNLTLTSALVKK